MSYEFDTTEGAGREAVASWLQSVRNDVAVRFMECERSLPLLAIETRAGVAPRSAYEALFVATERYFLVGDWMGLERAVRALHGVAADRGAAAGRIVSLLKVYRDALWQSFDRDPGPGLTARLLASLDDRLRDAEAACLADRLDRGAAAPLRLVEGDVRPSDAQATRLALACTDPDAQTAIPAVAQLLAVSIPFDRLALVLPDIDGAARCYESEVGLSATAIDRALVSLRPGDVLHAVDTGMTAAWCDGAHLLHAAPPLGLELAGCRSGVWIPLVGRTGMLGVGRISAVPVTDRELSDLLWAATIMAPAARAWTERLRLQAQDAPPEPPRPVIEEVLAPPEVMPVEEASSTWDLPMRLEDIELPDLPVDTRQPLLALVVGEALQERFDEDSTATSEIRIAAGVMYDGGEDDAAPRLMSESEAQAALDAQLAQQALDALDDSDEAELAEDVEQMPMFVLPNVPEEPVATTPPRRRHDDLGPKDHLHNGPPLIDRRRRSGNARWVAMAAGMLFGVIALGAALATVLTAGIETQANAADGSTDSAVAAVVQTVRGVAQDAVDPEFGFLTIKTTPPGVAVRVNGSVVGLSPLDWVQVPAGEVQVTVDRKGLKPWIKTLALDDAEHRKLRIELLADRAPTPTVASSDDVGALLDQTGL